MPIPAFDADTGCLPSEPRLHDCTIQEMRQRLVDEVPASASRPAIFAAWQAHTSGWQLLIGPEPAREQWLDGSFTTVEKEPEDIDLVMLVPSDVIEGLPDTDFETFAAFFLGSYTPEDALVHAFIIATYPDGHDLRPEEEDWRSYWLNDAFGKIQDTDEPKGLLRLQVGGEL